MYHCIPQVAFKYLLLSSISIISHEIYELFLTGYGYIPSDYPAHDITLLKLEHPVIVNNVTRPLCLPTMTSLDEVISRGPQAECYVIGLGLTEQYFSGINVSTIF
jgi:hypothetical protein